MERPLLIPLLGFIAGLVAAGIAGVSLSELYLLPLLAVTLIASIYARRLIFQIVLFIPFFLVGNHALQPYLHPELPSSHIAQLDSREPVVVEGIVVARPETTDRGFRLLLQAERRYDERSSLPSHGKLLLFVDGDIGDILTGDRVRCRARIKRPRTYGIPGEFDYPRYLAYRDIFATGFAQTGKDIILMERGADYPLQQRIDAVARRLGLFVDATVSQPESGILKALLLGDRGGVPRELEDAYTRSGVNHILSISGFHVGIIALFLFQSLFFAARSSEFLMLHLNLRRTLFLLTLPVLLFYLFLSGAAPATARSVITIAVYVLALALQRETDPINSLLLAALVILGINPSAIFEISFQLSFLAIWGILVLTPLFSQPFADRMNGIGEKTLLFFFVSVAATLVTLIPVAYYFHRVSLTGLVSNFIIVPLMGYGAVVLGFSALPFVYLAPFLAKLLLAGAASLVTLSDWFIHHLARIPVGTFINPDRIDLLLFYSTLTVFTFVPRRRLRNWGAIFLTIALVIHLFFLPDPGAGKLRISFLSVGQGDATLIRFPGGETMLVDGGGNPRGGTSDVGERLIAPALWKMGVSTIDYLVLTHPHPDHCQGLVFVAKNFKVGEFWEVGGSGESPDYALLKGIIVARKVRTRIVTADSKPFTIGGAVIEPLAPSPASGGRGEGFSGGTNNDSFVFRLVAGTTSILFTGDIGAVAEEDLLRRHAAVQCTVLKVAHHGSRFSSSTPFITAAAPRFAVISAGFDNSFHLPASESLATLERNGSKVFRTDREGTIEMECGPQGEGVVITPMTRHFN
ncbi:MAG: DNA internalization-related competence protein ComEC/Rec2 [Geobacter sp.]|nr:MAG: DNA internalization-related competence protein ComEC/Rec2 [Geobacter sp.]